MSYEFQSAVTAEFIDFQENIRNEDCIMVQGLAKLPKLDPKEWQVRARAAVDSVIELLGLPHKVKYVQNSTGKGKDSKTLFKAKMESTAVSKEIRDKFSGFFSGGTDSRPASLSQVSIRNCVTPGTLARIAILQLLGRRYRDSNPGSRMQVVAYESRPLLKLTPPPGASDTRVMTFSYIEAITKLPTSFSQEEIDALLKRVSPRLLGSLRQILFVITDDMIKKKSPAKKKAPGKSAKSAVSSKTAESASGSESSEFRTPEAGQNRKRGPPTPSVGPASKK